MQMFKRPIHSCQQVCLLSFWLPCVANAVTVAVALHVAALTLFSVHLALLMPAAPLYHHSIAANPRINNYDSSLVESSAST